MSTASPPVNGSAGPRDEGEEARPLSRRVVVFSSREVIAQGLVGLLPREWRERATIAIDLGALEAALAPGWCTTIVDCDSGASREAVQAARARSATIVLVASGSGRRLEPEMIRTADAILVRDEVDAVMLRVALATGHLGLQLLSRSLPLVVAPADDDRPALVEPARRALRMLAEGFRDAEIARELNLSESAVRKLIQRTVHTIGARTRCEAVALSARRGLLG